MSEAVLLRLWNVIVSGVEIYLLYYLLKRFPLRKKKRMVQLIAFLLLLMVEMTLTYFNTYGNIKIILLCVLALALIKYGYDVKAKEAIFLVFVFVFSIILSEFIAFAILYSVHHGLNFEVFNSSLLLFVEGATISKSINFVILVAVNRIINKKREAYGIREYLLLFLPLVTNILILLWVYEFTYMEVENASVHRYDMLIISLVIALSSVMAVAFFEHYMRSRDNQQNVQALQHRLAEGARVYKSAGREESASPSGASGKEAFEVQALKLLDAVHKNAEELGIRFARHISLSKVAPQDGDGALRMLKTALGYALQACSEIEESRPYINISVMAIGSYFVLKLSFGDQGAAAFRPGASLGLAALEKQVKRQRGELQHHHFGEYIELSAMIPLQID